MYSPVVHVCSHIYSQLFWLSCIYKYVYSCTCSCLFLDAFLPVHWTKNAFKCINNIWSTAKTVRYQLHWLQFTSLAPGYCITVATVRGLLVSDSVRILFYFILSLNLGHSLEQKEYKCPCTQLYTCYLYICIMWSLRLASCVCVFLNLNPVHIYLYLWHIDFYAHIYTVVLYSVSSVPSCIFRRCLSLLRNFD